MIGKAPWRWRHRASPPRHAAPGVLPGEHATGTDRAMMARALDLAAHAASLGEVPVGAVVYETATGRELAHAFNRRELDKNPAAHAELRAIIDAARVLGDWRLNACTLAVTLEPCPMCAGLIVNARVGRVIYAADDPKAGACRSVLRITSEPRLNHRPVVIGGVLAEPAAELLRSFFQVRRPQRRAGPDHASPGFASPAPGSTDAR